jgi:site-specific recombinase XerC
MPTGPRAYGPYKHGDRWRVHFVSGRGGNRTTSYETFDTWAEADRCKSAATDEAQGISVADAVKAYLDTKRAQGRSPETVSSYEARLGVLLADLMKRPVRSVTKRGAELYAGVLTGRKPDSHQNLLRAGKLWAKFCIKQRWLKSNPFDDVEPVGQRTYGADKERLTTDESRVLEAWCLEHHGDVGAVLALAYLYLGARNTELTKRDVRDVDDDGRVLWIGKTKSRAGRRKLAIPPGLSDMLLALCAGRAGDEPIFKTRKKVRMRRETARKHVRRVCALAGVRELPPQALRRTWASLADEAGQAPLAIARHLGQAVANAPRVTEQAYIHRGAVDDAKRRRVAKALRGGN